MSLGREMLWVLRKRFFSTLVARIGIYKGKKYAFFPLSALVSPKVYHNSRSHFLYYAIAICVDLSAHRSGNKIGKPATPTVVLFFLLNSLSIHVDRNFFLVRTCRGGFFALVEVRW